MRGDAYNRKEKKGKYIIIGYTKHIKKKKFNIQVRLDSRILSYLEH